MKSRQKTAKARSRSESVRALRAADAAWLKAYRAKNLEKAVGFYERQGAMLAPHSPRLTGRRALAKFIAKSFTMRDYRIWWHAKKAGVARSGELGYTSGTYRMSFRDASGELFSDKGKYLMVWRKQRDGEWKVLFDVSNSDMRR